MTLARLSRIVLKGIPLALALVLSYSGPGWRWLGMIVYFIYRDVEEDVR